jgi:RND family efflux transporter MFP subunit
MSTCRFLVPALLAIALLAGCSRPAPAPEPVRSVRTITVAPGSTRSGHEFAAEVRARTETRLGFRVGGKLVQRRVDVGQAVRAGQVLAQLDPADLQLGQEAARAALRAADVAAQQAKADFDRYKDLQAQGFIGSAELQRRETSWQAAQAQLAQAQAQAAVQGNQAAYSQLLAPADGVITGVDAEPGTVLATGASVLRLAHAGPRDAVFAVPEDTVASLRGLLGRPGVLQVRLWGRNETLPATLREVAAAADPATRTFLVKADLGAAVVELGQTANVVVPLPPSPGLTRLPLSALLQHKGQTVVWLLDPASMSVRTQAVQVAGADGNVALVASGLATGAEVVTAGVHVLTEGQKVTRYVAAVAAASAAQR